jgi:hypothetical protein
MWWQINLPHECHDIKVTNSNYCITVFRPMHRTLAVKLMAVISVFHNRDISGQLLITQQTVCMEQGHHGVDECAGQIRMKAISANFD